MIYLIGGTSRSGKTSVRNFLLNQYKISGIETDSIRTMLEIAAPELGIHYKNEPTLNARRLEPYLIAFIKARLFFDDDYVIEGDCVTPKVASQFSGNENIKSVFIGYPQMNVEDKLRQIREDGEGWTDGYADDELAEKLKVFIAHSKRVRQECLDNKLDFVDASQQPLKTVVNNALLKLNL